MAERYSIPIDFSSILQEKPEPLKKCSEIESIDQYLGLLLSTCPGEHKFDPDWGCKIWEQDFKLITARIKWETWCATVIYEMIRRYEHRLDGIKVEAKIMDVVKEEELYSTSTIRKRLDVNIDALLVSNGEPCRFYYKIYMGPICVE